ncbi:DEAD/DEAH box helicase [Geodermatophilus sp. CPCC 205506]|uniref:DEAD/DEAH box helicase n=1 Tax=Geodermatophilus sp. CPCC 205506 TaxID=2936596 RepID=UPI003EF02E27
MPFVRRTATGPVPEDPEQLYRLLAESNSGPAALWGHQQDVVRSWHQEHESRADVAIELPTGAGKTLVGGLLGEFRRRVAGDRVAYLCPTRQLARQTAARLTEYGIPNVLLIGKAVDFNQADRARYTGAQAIAVSVYHHVFNSNPALNDAQMLVLDDAHAAEQAVAGPWSLRIDRTHEAYMDVLALLPGALDPHILDRLRTDSPDRQYLAQTYLASPVGLAAVASELEAALDTAASTRRMSKDARYALKQMAGRLDRCLVYVSYRSILFRPLVTPTAVHAAFEQPARRLYMSATLGAGGELERAFGRRKIARVPIPKGWDKQGTGRRFFCFPEFSPDLAATPLAVPDWVRRTVAMHGRSVVLTPDERTAQNVAAQFIPEGFQILRGDDVEDDLEAFTTKPQASLLLANRYDGIDLPDEDCRLVVIAGLPARGDLQERFLYGSLGALEVLQERIRARFVQGAGRATRNAKDFSTVVVLGGDLTNYVNRREVTEALQPEVQAELSFGFANSLANSSEQLLDGIREFLGQTEAWHGANSEIVAERETRKVQSPAGTVQLAAAAQHEVSAWQAAWQGEWDRALESARAVLDALSGGRDVQRYGALWNYLAGCWALRLASVNGDATLQEAARDYYQAARAGGRGTSWLDHLTLASDMPPSLAIDAVDPVDRMAAEGIQSSLQTLGKPARFESAIVEMHAGLSGRPPKPSENALVRLGELAGAESKGNGGATAAPDATWRFGNVLWVSWEAKSDAEPEGELGPEDVRQAGAHLRYMSAESEEDIPLGSFGLLMTPQARVHKAARSVAEDHVFLVRRDDVLDLLDGLTRAWRSIRSGNGDVGSILSALHTEGVLPSMWATRLQADPLAAGAEEWSSDG